MNNYMLDSRVVSTDTNLGNRHVTTWAVATVVPHSERRAVTELDDLGHTTYVPRYETTEAIHGRIQRRARPLFPGYVFVVFTEMWATMMQAEHVFGLLGADVQDEPYTLHHEVVDELRSREAEDGLIHFQESRHHRYRRGQRVRVKRGPFMNCAGIVDRLLGIDRVQVLMSMLGRQTTVQLREAEVTAG